MADRLWFSGHPANRGRCQHQIASLADKEDPAFMTQVDDLYRVLTKKSRALLQPDLDSTFRRQKLAPVPVVRAGAMTGLIEL